MTESKVIRHSSTFKDLTGLRFERLTVLNLIDDGSRCKWLCRCDCGKESAVFGGNLRRGLTKSCGCFRLEAMTKHGKEKHREYKSWHAAKQRCTNPKSHAYADYGARGITMCDKWLESFDAFFADMGPCPPNLTLDRIDNNGPYTGPCAAYPGGNCRWASRVMQQSNKRNTIFATHEGETQTVKEWSRRSGERYRTLLYRAENGYPIFQRRRKRRY